MATAPHRFRRSANSAWRLVKRDAQPVVVAAIDTGLDWDDRNIDWDNIWHNPKETADTKVDDVIGWDFIDQTNRPWDYDGHGTFIAGLIAGSWKDKDGIAGINPFARLMILKTLNNFGHTRASYIAEAIADAADNGARVINISAGGAEISAVEQAAIDYAYGKGAVIVVAAGNEGVDTRNYGIAASDKVLTVGSTGLDDRRPCSRTGATCRWSRPASTCLSLRARRTDVIRSVEGAKYTAGAAFVAPTSVITTRAPSFSAPLVTGLASLMIANDPTLTNRQVMNIIKSTARDVGIPGVDQFTGYGLIDARAALQAPNDYFLFAGIGKVEVARDRGAQVVRVLGTADANMLKSARIEIGKGDNPTEWKAIGPVKKGQGPNSVLGDIPASAFAGSKVWQLRVIVEHGSGAQREARFKLTLG